MLNCKVCNILLIRKPSWIIKNKNHFCSMKCKSKFMKGKPTWNKGIKGKDSHMFGRKVYHSEETRKKISQNSRKYQTLETREKISNTMGRKKKTREHSFNISKGHKGKIMSEETKIKLSKHFQGEKSSLWRGGISFEPYDLNFTNRFKKIIKERDGNCCMVCHMSQYDLKLLKRYLQIHHINYDKKLTIKENCITLCQPCHAKTNFNRNQWVTFFQSLLKEKYEYRYDSEQKVILEYV